MKTTEQYFSVVLFTVFLKVVLTVESVDGFLVWPFELKLISYFPVVIHAVPYKIASRFGSMNEAQVCDHSIRNCWVFSFADGFKRF